MTEKVFLSKIEKKKIIIFGCGKNGKIIFEYLKKKKWKDKICCFADNSAGHYAKHCKGKKVLRPETVKKQYKNAIWILSSPRYAEQMKTQLCRLGISERDILQITDDDIRYINKNIYKYWYDEGKYFLYDYGFPVSLKSFFKQTGNVMRGWLYDLQLKKADSDRNVRQNYKYQVSICAIFLNEAPYMREWIEFHRIVGVEHFYLYNNMSTDEYQSVLEPYVKEGIVTLINWDVPQGQIPAYWDCVKKFSRETRWLGFIDLDEFVVPRKKENAIYDILKPYNDKCGAVLIYWKVFGSGGMMKRDINGLVTEDFKKCWPKLEDVGKCFYNTAYSLSGTDKNGLGLHHICWTKKGNRDFPPVNIYGKISVPGGVQRASGKPASLQINHYLTKSYEEYQKKIKQPDSVSKVNPRTKESFCLYNSKATTIDGVIEQYLLKLKKALNKV